MSQQEPKKCKIKRELVKVEWVGGRFKADGLIKWMCNLNIGDENCKTNTHVNMESV